MCETESMSTTPDALSTSKLTISTPLRQSPFQTTLPLNHQATLEVREVRRIPQTPGLSALAMLETREVKQIIKTVGLLSDQATLEMREVLRIPKTAGLSALATLLKRDQNRTRILPLFSASSSL